MTAQPDPQLVREIVRSAIGYVTRDSVRCRLIQAAIAEHGVDEHDLPTWSGYYDAAIEAMGSATATGVWPDEKMQDDGPDDTLAMLDADAPTGPPRTVAEYWHGYAMACSDGGRNATWASVAHVAACILGAMNAEQAARDADVRAVAVYMRNRADTGAASAVLYELFKDRIAELEARTGDGGAS